MKLVFVLVLFSYSIFAQNFSIEGYIKDSENSKPLRLVNIFVKELNIGTSSNEEGKYHFENIKPSTYSLRFSSIGYKTLELKEIIDSSKTINISLHKSLLHLGNIVVEGTFPKFTNSAVAISTISKKNINNRLGAKETANILEEVPSVYIANQGGGIGEARLSLRGFAQTNIAVMINGVPINNPENGQIYWSNWTGISDMVEQVNVQRGLSAIPYSTSSIGGSVNFITNNLSNTSRKIKLKTQFGSFNIKKLTLNFSSQLSKRISVAGLISRKLSDGYADNVYSNELTYFLVLGYVSSKHILQFQLFGSPQKHGQRLTPQKISTWEKYGLKYNSDWGYLNGKPLNLRDNEFHNPTLNISHNWQISKQISLSNIISLSHGFGGGTVPPWYPELSKTEDGLIDFDSEFILNSNNKDVTYSKVENRAVLALRKGVHKNYLGNLISVLKYRLDDFVLRFGVDGKLYEAENYNELSNLLGGDYYIGSNNINDNPNRLLRINDKVDFYAKSFTRGFGCFFQSEYKKNRIEAYFNLAVSSTGYNRIDYFNHLVNSPKREISWKNFYGYTIKLGINYKINLFNNLYFNIGKFSKAPLSMNVYDYSNNLYENVKNENILSLEIGYGFKNNFSEFNLNYYNTFWKDKAFSQSYLSNDSSAIYYYNLFGASANHSGLELDGKINLSNNLKVLTAVTYSNNKWTSDVDAFVRPEANPNNEIKYHSFTKNLYVGGFPMITGLLGIFYQQEFSNNIKFFINPTYRFYGKYFSQFFPELRTDMKDAKLQPWRMPDFFKIDLHLGAEINIKTNYIKTINLTFHIFNLLNKRYIADSFDGLDHSAQTALVWYGKERWWSFEFSFEF